VLSISRLLIAEPEMGLRNERVRSSVDLRSWSCAEDDKDGNAKISCFARGFAKLEDGALNCVLRTPQVRGSLALSRFREHARIQKAVTTVFISLMGAIFPTASFFTLSQYDSEQADFDL
jgi:hypothetical protein